MVISMESTLMNSLGSALVNSRLEDCLINGNLLKVNMMCV